MAINFECTHCRAEIEAQERLKGTQLRCPVCRRDMTIPDVRLSTGEVLGDYRIVRLLGVGAMGQVYLAIQQSMEREVAFKLLPPEVTDNPDDVERFVREVRTLARINHPNVVTAFEAGVHDGLHFLAMSFVDGEDLDERLMREGRLPEREVLRYGLKVAETLQDFHEQHDLLHRDIKPSNIMIDRLGDVKLMDMGISKRVQERCDLTTSGIVIGTPFYMSPEQARGSDDLDFRSDMYALGATLFHLLTGSVPHAGDTPMDVLLAVCNEPTPSARKRCREVSAEASELLRNLMARDRDKRYRTWDDAIRDFRRVSKGKPPTHGQGGHSRAKGATPSASKPHATPAPTPKPQPAPVVTPEKGSPLPLIVSLLVLLGVLGAGTYFFLQHRQRTADQQAREEAARREQDEAERLAAERRAAAARAEAERLAAEKAAEQAELDAAAVARFNELQALVAAGYLREAFAGLRDFQQDFEGHPLTTQARALSRDLLQRQQEEIDAAWESLRRQVDARAREADRLAAAQLLREYNGRFAAELQARRDELADELEDAHRDALAAEAALAQQAKAGFDELLLATAEALLEGDAEGAVQALTEARQQPWAKLRDEELKTLAAQLLAATTIPQRLGDSLRAEQGKEITVALDPKAARGDPKYTGEILRVTDGQVEMNRQLVGGRGSIRVTFAVTDLAAKEKLERLGRGDAADAQLARGALLLELERSDLAERCFRAADCPLGSALARALVWRDPVRREEAAEQAWQALLTGLDYTSGADPATLIARFWQDRPEPEQRPAARQALAEFRRDFGHSRLGRRLRPVLLALHSALSDEVRSPTDEALAATREKLREFNNIDNLHFEVDRRPTGVWLDLRQNDRLRDLEPLRGLGLQGLLLDGCPVADLAPLTGLPLLEITLSGAEVRDLGPLANLPLQRLVLDGCPAADLGPLANVPLRELSVASCPVHNLTPLLDLPLRSLSLYRTPVADLKPLAQLEHLEQLVLPANAREVDFLKELPILRLGHAPDRLFPAAEFWAAFDRARLTDAFREHLAQADRLRRNLLAANPDLKEQDEALHFDFEVRNGKLAMDLSGNPRLSDISPLQGLPLQVLDVSETAVSDLAAVTEMPLEVLNASESRVVSISQLRGKETLRRLYLGYCEVPDISPVATLPNLETLTVSGCDDEDLRHLEKLPLRSLTLHRFAGLSLRRLRNLPLRHLAILGSRIDDLKAIRRLELESVELSYTGVGDLGPLKGMPITHLEARHSPVKSLTPLRGMPLRHLELDGSGIADLGPLRGLPLQFLDIDDCPVRSLSPLSESRLEVLHANNTRIVSLSGLQGLPLRHVELARTDLSDRHLEVLAGSPVETLLLHDCQKLIDLSVLRQCEKLERLTVPEGIRKMDGLRDHPKLAHIQWFWDEDHGWELSAQAYWKHRDR